MKFKLLHVRPHVWFFKQKETIAKPSSDDTSSSEGTYVYKRSTSLKLVKSDRHGRTCNNLHASKPSSTTTGLRPQLQGKDVKVCTVVDAGCTCRATVTSQHKAQKKGLGAYIPNANGGLGSLHDVCRPRWAPHVFEARGEDVATSSRHDMCRPRRGQLNPKRAVLASNMSPSPLGTSSSMVSRLVCKSQDVVKTHAQFNVEQCDVVNNLPGNTESHVRVSYTGEDKGLDVHQSECRSKNAGLEERRRSLKKKNKYYEDGGSSGVSSTNSRNYSNTDSLITCTTTEMQDMLLNVNPAFDTDVPSSGDSMLSLEDLRASIAQRKLSNYHNLQDSPSGKDAAQTDGLHVNAIASMCSPSSSSTGNMVASCRVSPSCACEENSSVKRSSVAVSKRLCFSEGNDLSNQGVTPKKSPRKACLDTSSVRSKVVRGDEDSRLPKRASRRIDLSVQKEWDVQHGVKRSTVNRLKGEVYKGPKRLQEADNKPECLSFAEPESVPICAGAAAHDEIGQADLKQAASSSSCEIQVLSDYSFHPHGDDNHTYRMMKMHANGTSAAQHAQAVTHSVQAKFGIASSSTPGSITTSIVDDSARTSLEHKLMQSDSTVAMVKSSYDPKLDFKESMLEMVVAKQLRAPRQLQQLLQCYFSLNPPHYHPTIIKAFHELCSELFH